MDIDKAFETEVQSFKDKNATSKLVKLVSTFGGEDIYRPNVLSTYRADGAMKSVRDGGLKHHVDLMIHVARTKDGKSMFKEAHRDKLMKQVEYTVLRDIAAELLESVIESRIDDPND